MDNGKHTYNEKIILWLVAFIIFLLCVISFTKGKTLSLAFEIILQGMFTSLFASFLFYLIFRKFNSQNKRERNICPLRNIDPIFLRVGTRDDIKKEEWINLISELDTTKEVIYFYGNNMKSWVEGDAYKKALSMKLRNLKIKKGEKKPKIYIILREKEYLDKWRSFIKENMKEGYHTYVSIYSIDGFDSYSIVCCGSKMSITARTKNLGQSNDNPTFEVPTESSVGKLFLDYLKYVIQTSVECKNV